MTENEQKIQNWIERYTDGIRKGIYTFADIGARDTKEIVKNNLMPEIEDGTANETTVDAVVKYFIDQVKRRRMTLQDVPGCVYDKVEEGL